VRKRSRRAGGVKKHLFLFQGWVEFLSVNYTLLFEGGEGRGLGFYLCSLLPMWGVIY
jgi:hypothetical protein